MSCNWFTSFSIRYKYNRGITYSLLQQYVYINPLLDFCNLWKNLIFRRRKNCNQQSNINSRYFVTKSNAKLIKTDTKKGYNWFNVFSIGCKHNSWFVNCCNVPFVENIPDSFFFIIFMIGWNMINLEFSWIGIFLY